MPNTSDVLDEVIRLLQLDWLLVGIGAAKSSKVIVVLIILLSLYWPITILHHPVVVRLRLRLHLNDRLLFRLKRLVLLRLWLKPAEILQVALGQLGGIVRIG